MTFSWGSGDVSPLLQRFWSQPDAIELWQIVGMPMLNKIGIFLAKYVSGWFLYFLDMPSKSGE